MRDVIMATQRIYLVGTPSGETRLVRASVRSQALSHVANSMLNLRVATQDDLVEAISKGCSVENAKAPDQMEIEETK
jgi:hypothetical protein